MKDIWTALWLDYKAAWRTAWLHYKTIVGPFIKGTASYLWLLIAGLLELVTKGLYQSGQLLLKKIIEWFDKI